MIEYDKSGPIYMQIATDLLYRILSKDIEGKLDSMRLLAVEYSVTVVILNRSIRMLEDLKVIEIRRGIGSFVTEDQELLKKIQLDEAKKLTSNYVANLEKLDIDLKIAKKMMEEI